MPAVALRKESVDRNLCCEHLHMVEIPVALRKESVDRNIGCLTWAEVAQVALRKESVDRNSLKIARYALP